MTDEVSREDFDGIVLAVSDVVSRFCPGSKLRTVERTYQAWKNEPALICEIEIVPAVGPAWSGIAFESDGWSKVRKFALEDMSRHGGWPLAFSGDEMRLRLSLLPENELRKLSRLCTVPGLSMLRTTSAV